MIRKLCRIGGDSHALLTKDEFHSEVQEKPESEVIRRV
jgi:hypothetical protein